MRKKYKDFKEYMQQNYYNEIFQSVEKFAYANKGRLNFESGHIYEVTYQKLDSIRVTGVTFKEAENEMLEIRVSVDAEFEIYGNTKYGRESDSATLCFCVFFHAFLENGLHDIADFTVEEYEKNKYERDRSLSQSLVPYMYEEDVEKHAEAFLHKHFPKALLQPMALPAYDILTAMGMKMYYAPLESNVFGKTYFAEERVKVYTDVIGNETVEIITSPGTMLINPNVYFMYNIGTANNTIIHECVHWDRHRRPFELQKLLEGDCSYITCEIVEKYDGMGEDASTFKWMEWQANQLAPRILMPAEMTKKKLDECLRRLHTENPLTRNAELFEKAVGELAAYFNVSMIAAKIRVEELGFDQAQGIRVFCNGRYLPPFSFPKGTIKKNQSFVIDEKNALFVMFVNPTLRELFLEGKIVYANSMICLNMPKYIMLNESGTPILTEYALEHVHECCFIFNRKFNVSNNYSDTFYRRCFLCKDVNSETFIEADYDPENKSNQSKEKRKEELSKIADFSEELAETMGNLPGSFSKTLRAHMKRRNINEEELSYRCNISTVMISNYLNHEDQEKKFASVLALCIGLNLHPIYMEDLIEKAGYSMKKDQAHFFVKFLIWNHPDDTIEEWQKKLDESHINIKLPMRKK